MNQFDSTADRPYSFRAGVRPFAHFSWPFAPFGMNMLMVRAVEEAKVVALAADKYLPFSLPSAAIISASFLSLAVRNYLSCFLIFVCQASRQTARFGPRAYVCHAHANSGWHSRGAGRREKLHALRDSARSSSSGVGSKTKANASTRICNCPRRGRSRRYGQRAREAAVGQTGS